MTISEAMTIDGASAASASTFEVDNPATGEVIGAAPTCTQAQLDAAVGAAGRAFVPWAEDVDGRRTALAGMAEALEANADELADLITLEQGKPRREARMEVSFAGEWFRYYAASDIPVELLEDEADRRVNVTYRPLGVVAAVTPWNFPVSSACWKISAALRAGNTVVLKPSPYTPLSVLRAGAIFQSVLPPGVLNVVSGDNALGAQLVAHPDVRMVSLTGSVGTGRQVALATAGAFKRTVLELGGNDPAIILEDADPQAIARKLFWGAFFNCGQVCTAIKRVYAPDSLYDDLVESLAALASSTTVGDGMAPETRIGPVNNRAQLEHVERLVTSAVADGAVVAAGGTRPDGAGTFFAPTVLAGATDDMAVVCEEQFGPVMPIVRYRTVEEALAGANGTPHGLGASVWSADRDRAAALAPRLDAGTVWINGHNVLPPQQPFGGHRSSGVGIENGRLGLMEYLDVTVVHEVFT